jgi:hypothetical protein
MCNKSYLNFITMALYAYVLCLYILALSRIPRYDLGRRFPSFPWWVYHTHAPPPPESDQRPIPAYETQHDMVLNRHR